MTLYCDFHGHSRQQNVFIYGCEDRANLEQAFKERVFPMMMAKNCEDKVGFLTWIECILIDFMGRHAFMGPSGFLFAVLLQTMQI